MRGLVTYTQLPELWAIFQSIIAMSPMTETGFTLMGASIYLEYYAEGSPFERKVLQVTHFEFWKAMTYFLGRMNTKFNERRKMRAKEFQGRT